MKDKLNRTGGNYLLVYINTLYLRGYMAIGEGGMEMGIIRTREEYLVIKLYLLIWLHKVVRQGHFGQMLMMLDLRARAGEEDEKKKRGGISEGD